SRRRPGVRRSRGGGWRDGCCRSRSCTSVTAGRCGSFLNGWPPFFFYGWTLWLYLNWLPSFFLHEYNLEIAKSALFSSAVFFAGVGGDMIGGTLSDAILKRTGDLRQARRNVVVGGFLGSFLCLVPIFATRDLTLIVLCLAGAFFFA